MPDVSYTLAEIVERLGGEVLGDAQTRVRQVATLSSARPDQISFLANLKYRKLNQAFTRFTFGRGPFREGSGYTGTHSPDTPSGRPGIGRHC